MTKHLSSSALSALDAYWLQWPAEAGTQKQRRIRLRLYLVYLLIRHGGLRLSEALNIDDNRDLVFSTSTIHVARDRDVQVEEQAMGRMLSIVEDPAVAELHGTITHVDPGYVRKNFYQAAAACGLEKDMGGPRVLRHTRGVELLGRGLPVSLVQKYLGLASPLQAIRLQEYEENEAREILHAHLRREALRRASTRNAFAGEITEIREDKNMSSVTLTSASGTSVTALISAESMRGLNLHLGQTVTATVKAPWVVLSPENTLTSYPNNLQATVLFIKTGILECSVRLRLTDGTGMAALMTMDSMQKMGLKEGTKCTASFSAMSVVLSPG